MNIGFTGSRHEPTREQKKWLLEYIIGKNVAEFHHGCCVGSDEFAHRAAKNCLDTGLDTIVLHPPSISAQAMKFTEWDYGNCMWYPKRDYLQRDRDIVNDTHILLALPNGPEKMRGSGTWYTVRYAVTKQKPVLICHPTGQVEERGTRDRSK